MSDCERFESTLAAYVAGDLDDRELGPLLAHARMCKECREILELHRDLTGLADRAETPGESEFAAMHARVLGRIDRPARSWHFPAGIAPRALAALAAGALLFVAGLAAGRIVPGASVGDGNGGVTSRLVNAINADAASNHTLVDVEDSRFTYSNVSFRRLDGDRVALDFDVTTHVGLVESTDSELVREVLVHSLLNPTNTGARLKAMSYAVGTMEPKVKDALLFAMRRDENLAVRLQALTILSDHLGDPEIEDGVLATLRDDESVQMRLLALDYLAAQRIDADRVDRIRDAIEERERPGDEAVILRLAEYENRL
jgi:hypothetical protein